jgi:hypothetical protein
VAIGERRANCTKILSGKWKETLAPNQTQLVVGWRPSERRCGRSSRPGRPRSAETMAAPRPETTFPRMPTWVGLVAAPGSCLTLMILRSSSCSVQAVRLAEAGRGGASARARGSAEARRASLWINGHGGKPQPRAAPSVSGHVCQTAMPG